MPKRRTHTKSRYGCDQCRHRRVKCDENPPRCANCISRNEICVFSRIAPENGFEKLQATHDHVKLVDQPPDARHAKQPKSLQLKPDRQADLELMHQWCCYTYTSAGSQWKKLFRKYVPKIALEHEYLLDSMFALSSFHLVADALDNTGDFEVARWHVSDGLDYYAHAISGLRADLEAFVPEKAAPVLFTSILVAAGAIVSPLLPVGSGEETEMVAEAFLPLADHVGSIESIKDVTVKHMKKTSAGKYIDKDWKSTQVQRPLYTMNLENSSRDSDAIPNWLVEAGPEFLDKLCRGEGVALAIYMYWGVLLDHLEDVWRAKFSGRRLVEELSARLNNMGSGWADATIWYRRQVGISPANDS